MTEDCQFKFVQGELESSNVRIFVDFKTFLTFFLKISNQIETKIGSIINDIRVFEKVVKRLDIFLIVVVNVHFLKSNVKIFFFKRRFKNWSIGNEVAIDKRFLCRENFNYKFKHLN